MLGFWGERPEKQGYDSGGGQAEVGPLGGCWAEARAGSGAGAVPGDVSMTAGTQGPPRVRVPQVLISAPFTEVVSPGTDPGVPHLHRPEVRGSKGHQDTRPLPKLEFYAKYKRGQSIHDHGHPLVQRAHFTDKQTEAKQLSVGFHVPNLGPFCSAVT